MAMSNKKDEMPGIQIDGNTGVLCCKKRIRMNSCDMIVSGRKHCMFTICVRQLIFCMYELEENCSVYFGKEEN